MNLPAHKVTTANLGAAYPFMMSPSLDCGGVYIGRDLLGGSFTYDPFELYKQGVISNTNMIIFGQIGRGKSSFVKSYLWRQSVFGRQAWVLDPKGEYDLLAKYWGVIPLKIYPSGPIRLNPLEDFGSYAHVGGSHTASAHTAGSHTGGSEAKEEYVRRCVELLVALIIACLNRSLLPTENAASQLAFEQARQSNLHRQITIPDVVEALLNPTHESARKINTDREELAHMGRDLGLELRRLVVGDLKGMFDGPSSEGIDLSAPLVIIDLSRLYESHALGALMTCCLGWLNALLSVPSATKRFIVIDEAWAILRNLSISRWLQSSWKLSRSRGVSNIAVLHRTSDLRSAGSMDSEQVSLASGLLSDSETKVIYSQPQSELENTKQLLGVSSTEAELLPNLRKGTGLWKVGRQSFLVEHRLGPAEYPMIDTDQRLR